MIQGTQEWLDARRGFITGSKFGAVMSKSRVKGALSKTAETYLNELLAGYLTGEPQGFQGNWATEWGNEHEDEARAAYTWETGNSVERVGFIEHPSESLVGCSPDGLIGSDGMLEVKCPFNSAVHVSNALRRTAPEEHDHQIHGNLWCTERAWCDFVSYDPRISERCQLIIVRVNRDERLIKQIAEKVAAFRELLMTRLEKLTNGKF